MEPAGALPGRGEEYVTGRQPPFCFVCTDDPPLLTAGTFPWAACGGGNLSMKNWLSTWGLRKMSNFSEHLSSVGKYNKKVKLDAIVPHSKVLLILPLASFQALCQDLLPHRAFLCYVNVPSLIADSVVPSRCSFRTKALVLSGKSDDCS